MQIVEANWPLSVNAQNQKITAFTTTRVNGSQDDQSSDFKSFNLGLHVGDVESSVLKNRHQLMQYCQLENAQWLEQVHGIDCVKANRSNQVPIADACWTDEADLACIVMTADCLPVAMRQGETIAVAHAGWRGLLAGVLESSLSVFDVATTDIWLGPAIGQNAFEVGQEVRDYFVDDNSENTVAFIAVGGEGKWMADIYRLAKIRLIKAGIAPERIYGGEQCTFSENERFYSYRRTSTTGRMATVIYRTKVE